MPRDTRRPSGARENVITVPRLYIFINEALIGIRGNGPGLDGGEARARVQSSAGHLTPSSPQNQDIRGCLAFSATLTMTALCVLCQRSVFTVSSVMWCCMMQRRGGKHYQATAGSKMHQWKNIYIVTPLEINFISLYLCVMLRKI